MMDKSIVGDLINFRGLVYAPLNENGVVFLFGKVVEDLNMYIEEIKPGFPDCIARRFNGKGWEQVRVEFEYKSRNFKSHKHNPKDCDIIICWEHDWSDCPLEVIELKDRIKELDNRPIQRPDADLQVVDSGDIEKWFDNFNMSEMPRKIFFEIINYAKSVNDACFYKVGKTNVSIYSPNRVFIYLFPRKRIIRLNVFTNGQPLEGVKQFDFEKGGEKWGGLSIGSMQEFERAKTCLQESLARINIAVKNNEPTGWYAKVEDISDDE